MRASRNVLPVEQTLAGHFPHLRPAQHRGLALWVYGTILAQSACQNAVIAALLPLGRWHALRQHLREWLYDGADRAVRQAGGRVALLRPPAALAPLESHP